MNKILTLTLLLFSLHVGTAQSPINISDARTKDTGTVVTIQGVVTNGSELGNIRYIQDATGGLPAFQNPSVGDFTTKVKRGDIVKVTGKLKDFNNLLEIDPINSYTIVSSGNPLPVPLVVSPTGMNESTESKLIKINYATFANGGATFQGNTSYTITSNGETCILYIRNGHPLVGKQIPLAATNITGISSQFRDQYQLLPRDNADLEVAAPFYISSAPQQSGIKNDGFTISWATNVAGNGWLRYGTDVNNMNLITSLTGLVANYSVPLTGLQPAEFYYVQAVAVKGTDTARSNILLCSTASNSSGEIKVYFNQSVDTSFSVNGARATGTSAAKYENDLVSLIGKATSTIDVAMYNNSRPTVVSALVDAAKRGVRVRYVAEDETDNIAITPPPNEFKVLKINTAGLMHNKFFVIDAASVDKSWVIAGSMNLTTQNMLEDFNNMLFIQDQALAKAYVREMDEMWGSTNETPNIFKSRSGPDKTDNTPHKFKVGGVDIECYFSPTDAVTTSIINTVKTADKDLSFGILSFTMDAIANAVRDAKLRNVNVRGMIENINDQGSELTFLQQNNVNVKAHTPSGLLHHKYLIVDATAPASDPIVLTGSHNWSNTAETRNDENTIIVHDARIANIFQQEFEKRWAEVVTGLQGVIQLEGVTVNIFPNPAADFVQISLTSEKTKEYTIGLYDATGNLLRQQKTGSVSNVEIIPISLQEYPAGNYFLTVSDGKAVMARKVVVQK